MQQPLISIIVPVYKVEQWLDKCVNSVVTQSYQNLQILLVDDGSPDRCGAMCDAWAQKDSRIQVIHKQNGGLSSARNAGLDLVQGEFVMCVDSDDVLHPDICKHLYEMLAKHDAGVAICDAAHIFGDAEPEYAVSEACVVMSSREAIREMWYQKSFLPSAWAKLYTSSVFASHRFTEGRLYEDIDIMHLLLVQTEKVVYTPSRMYGYVHREDSITTKPFGVRDLDILKVADKILSYARGSAPDLLPAAEAYAVVAALRVELNAPDTPELTRGHEKARTMLLQYGKSVLKDANIRKKTRIGLSLYFYCRPLMRAVYKHVNRWK